MTSNGTRQRPLRVGLVGCGQIADAHLEQIAELACSEVTAVCDVYLDVARQAAARFDVPAAYDDVDAMVAAEQLDVVHLTTPAETHGPLTLRLLDAGLHVYVEKPVALDAREAAEMVAAAQSNDRLLCVGHDQLFDPLWVRAKHLVHTGALGEVRHVESVVGYALGGEFGRAVAGDPQHWVHRLPGGLFQNTISHPVYRITELLSGDALDVAATWRRLDGRHFETELLASIHGAEATATLQFATTISPQRITRIHGELGACELDHDGQVLRRFAPSQLPGAFEKLERPLRQLVESGANLWRGMSAFARSDIHYFAGMRELFERFHSAIADGGPPPVAYGEVIRVTQLMDDIFAACRAEAAARGGPGRSW